MCGIAGFCVNPKEHLPRQEDMAAALLCQIESRGTDSTGMAWADASFRAVSLRKQAIPARTFVERGLSGMGNDTQTAVLHTRYATKGSPENNGNNHPITQGTVVGVHNGHLSNDDDLFRTLGVNRMAEVDSEAAFALLAHGDAPVTELLPQLRGRAALAWMDRRDTARGPILHLARVTDSPLAIGQTPGGSLLFASTMSLLHRSCEDLNVDLSWDWDVEEGTYLQVQRGKVIGFERFAVPQARSVYSFVSRHSSGRTANWQPNDLDDDAWEYVEGEWIDDDTFIPYP